MAEPQYKNIAVPKISNTWNAKLNAYIQGGYTENKNFDIMISKFLNFCEIRNGILLEIGCGSGWFRRYIKGVDYIGTEVLIRKDVDLDFPIVVTVGENLPFKDGSFDHILILATLDHVFDPLKVISESFGVLKRGGTIYILNTVKLPNGPRKVFVYGLLLLQKVLFFDLKSIKRNFKKVVLKREDEFHTFEFNTPYIEAMLSKAGFSGILRKNFLNSCFFKAKKPLE